MKKFTILILMLTGIISTNIFGQPNEGDYRSSQTGSWSTAGCWEKYSSGSWTAASASPPLVSPWITTRVTIQSSHTITATGAISGASGGVLEVASGGTLNMGSYIIKGYTTSGTGRFFPTVTINGNLNTSTWVNATTFAVGSSGKFTTSYNGLNGWWSGTLAPSTKTLDGTIEFGSGVEKIPGSAYSLEYYNLIVSGDSKAIVSDLTVNGKLTIDSDATLVLNGNYLFMNGSEISLAGELDGTDSYLYFDGGTQSITGTGTFVDVFEEINVGSATSSNVTLSNANILSINNLIITAGKFTVGATSKVDVNISLDIVTNGLLLTAATSAPYTCASLIIAPDATVTGNVKSEIYLTGGGDETNENFEWHYISPPVSSVPVSTFAPTPTEDLAQFIESRVTGTLLTAGWVASDGYVYSTGVKNGPTFPSLTAGKGYNYWDGDPQTFTLTGTPNKSNTIITLENSGYSKSGFNLIGNPFTAGLNWDDIQLPSGLSNAIYFTRSNESCSYAYPVGNPYGVTGVIPPMQGFFVKTSIDDISLTLPAAARTHTNIHARYKGIADIPLVRLRLKKNNISKDETVVRFDYQAKSDYDLTFDALKMSGSTKRTQIYSSMSGTDYSINGQPFPETSMEIPINMSITKDTIHTISAFQIQNLDNYNLALKDLTSGLITDLRSTPNVTFSAGIGTLTGRFVLMVSTKTTGVENSFKPNSDFRVYSLNNYINIQTLSDEWDGKQGSVKVLDLAGRIVTSLPDEEFSMDSEIRVPCKGGSGMYLVEIRSGLMRHVGKVVVK